MASRDRNDPHLPTARLMKVLGHPRRLQILETLAHEDEACVCHLEARLGLRQAYLSQQLMILRGAGLVAERRDGTYVFYRLSDPSVSRLIEMLQTAAGLPRVEVGTRGPAGCPCPECAPRDTQRNTGGRRPRQAGRAA